MATPNFFRLEFEQYEGVRVCAPLFEFLREGDRLGYIADPLGGDEQQVLAAHTGVVIGRSELPIVNEGDAIFHIATFKRPEAVAESVGEFNYALSDTDEG